MSRSVSSRGNLRIGAAALVAAVAIAIAAAASMPMSHALALGQTAQAFVCNFGGNSVTIYPAGSDGTNPPDITTVAGGETELESPVGIALAPDATPGLTKLYLTNCGQDCGGEGASSVNVYEILIPADGGNVNAPVIGMITGGSTGLDEPLGIALDSSENIYVVNDLGGNSKFGSVTVYPAGSDGDVAPTATIAGGKTGFDFPTGIALDSSQNIYVANCGENCGGDNASSVEIFAAGSNGNVAPTATIIGTNTGLVDPFGIALDSGGNIYVANELAGQNGRGSVTIYRAGSKNNAKPFATIVGKKTTLHTPAGLALDSAGNIYVANFGAPNVTVFAAGSKGNVAPSATISSSGLDQPLGIALPPASPTPSASPTPTATGGTPTPTATPTPGLGTLSFDPNPLDFGDSTKMGKTKTKDLTIKNTSAKSSKISVTIGSEDTSPPFAVKTQCTKTLAPGKSCKVSVTFTPPNTTPQMGQLTITDDAQDAPQTVQLSGTAK